jgi:hypothetical protein
MTFTLYRASTDTTLGSIEINTIEELRDKLEYHEFIVNFDSMEITIYDWYVE